jgi:signal transduction histidine kinase
VKVFRDLSDRKRMEDELRQARAELEERVAERTAELESALESLESEMARRRDLARRLASAQEDERRRLSRELHDSVGQLLTGLSFSIKAAESASPLSPAAEELAEVGRLTNALAREVHGLAVRLRPTVLDDVGLEAALAQLGRDWSVRSNVPVKVRAVGVGRLPAEVETTVYRVVQEALTNVAKHAGATLASVVVTRTEKGVSVVVEDDGTGFDPDHTPKGRLGLLGMRERAELAGGVFEIESSPGAGVTVVMQIPLQQGGGS